MRLVAVMFGIITPAIVILVFAQGYVGRVALHDSQLAGCERGKLDRSANAQGWRAAEKARRAGGTPLDLRTAALYDRIADGLERRSLVDCVRAFPEPRVIGK